MTVNFMSRPSVRLPADRLVRFWITAVGGLRTVVWSPTVGNGPFSWRATASGLNIGFFATYRQTGHWCSETAVAEADLCVGPLFAPRRACELAARLLDLLELIDGR